MRALILHLSLLASIAYSQQTVYDYAYNGGLGEIVIDSLGVLPNAEYRIDFCTANIPDQLTVWMGSDSIKFWVGDFLQTNHSKGEYHGYAEFLWTGKTLSTLIVDGKTSPIDFGCDKEIGGRMRLKIIVPSGVCKILFRVRGNLKYYTVYSMKIDQLSSGFYEIIDTIYPVVCEPLWPRIVSIGNCKYVLSIPVDSSIAIDPTIIHPDCEELNNGSITFDRYPQYNHYRLFEGQYKIKIDNGFCQKEFFIDLISTGLCQWYVPNVFKPESIDNNQFIFYTPNSIDYQLTIFDRWGNMIYQNIHQSNVNGWDGGDHQTGVYVWKIDYRGTHLHGDVTLIR